MKTLKTLLLLTLSFILFSGCDPMDTPKKKYYTTDSHDIFLYNSIESEGTKVFDYYTPDGKPFITISHEINSKGEIETWAYRYGFYSGILIKKPATGISTAYVFIEPNGSLKIAFDDHGYSLDDVELMGGLTRTPRYFDYKGYKYPIVKIGTDLWMRENLKAELGSYNSPYGTQSLYHCYYDRDPKNASFGLLYNAYIKDLSIKDTQGGTWKLPSNNVYTESNLSSWDENFVKYLKVQYAGVTHPTTGEFTGNGEYVTFRYESYEDHNKLFEDSLILSHKGEGFDYFPITNHLPEDRINMLTSIRLTCSINSYK
jgi:hypothetical protein